MLITPAYTDLKSVKAVREAFEAGKDFTVMDIDSPYRGKPCNKADLVNAGIRQVTVRYAYMSKVTIINF